MRELKQKNQMGKMKKMRRYFNDKSDVVSNIS